MTSGDDDAPTPVPARVRLPRGRRYAVRALLVVATIVGIVGRTWP